MELFSEKFWEIMSERHKLSPELLRIAVFDCQAGLDVEEISKKLNISQSKQKYLRFKLYNRLHVTGKFQMLRFFIKQACLLAAVLIIIFCAGFDSDTNEDCITNYKDLAEQLKKSMTNLKSYATFAKSWLKIDARFECQSRKLQREYQVLCKIYWSAPKERNRLLRKIGLWNFVEMFWRVNKSLAGHSNSFIVVGAKE
jgi:hypothetical protein